VELKVSDLQMNAWTS